MNNIAGFGKPLPGRVLLPFDPSWRTVARDRGDAALPCLSVFLCLPCLMGGRFSGSIPGSIREFHPVVLSVVFIPSGRLSILGKRSALQDQREPWTLRCVVCCSCSHPPAPSILVRECSDWDWRNGPVVFRQLTSLVLAPR